MIGKAVVKVTLNEATDPDLFAFIKQFDNERMRAGALRALARAALNGWDVKRVASSVQPEPLMRMTEPSTHRPKPAVTNAVESDPTMPPSPEASPVAALQPREPSAPVPMTSVAGSRRFDTDAIADQFADF